MLRLSVVLSEMLVCGKIEYTGSDSDRGQPRGSSAIQIVYSSRGEKVRVAVQTHWCIFGVGSQKSTASPLLRVLHILWFCVKPTGSIVECQKWLVFWVCACRSLWAAGCYVGSRPRGLVSFPLNPCVPSLPCLSSPPIVVSFFLLPLF